MFVILKSSKRHHNKSYEYENNNKSRQKTKNSEKCKKVSEPIKL